ncbi:hypothetical protein D037_0464B, partial [Vibrio parahaemolyticus IDH02640]
SPISPHALVKSKMRSLCVKLLIIYLTSLYTHCLVLLSMSTYKND